MKYAVTVYGDPILRQRAKEISPDMEGLSEIIDNMWETMYYSDGVGLAAPQVGMSIRLFVIDASAYEEEEPQLKDFKRVFINPKLIELGGNEWIMNEGCLSLPEIREDVTRPETIHITYADENFVEHDEIFSGYAARIIQHEYDHLEGKLFIDYLLPLRKRLLKGKLTSITLGKIQPHYKIKIPVR